jgi:NAD(P)-dependent dehydrogenase (short-subunit alcohol dehydrogenase family)
MSNEMNNKTVLITGGTGGIGKHTAIGLAKLGARVVVTGRDKQRGESAVKEIQKASGNKDIDLLLGDLSLQAEVRKLAGEVKARYSKLGVFINNAGLLEPKHRLTKDGIEADFAVNVVTPYLLTLELLPLLKASAPSRVINLTGGIPTGKIDLQNLQAEKSFLGLVTYSHAKQIMEAMSLEMSKRLEGSGISVIVAYPGSAGTAMTGAMTPDMLPFAMRLIWPIFKIIMRDDGGKSAAKASRSSVFAASSPELAGETGIYLNTNSKRARWSPDILDAGKRKVIWEKLEEMTGSRLPSAQANPSPFIVSQARGVL